MWWKDGPSDIVYRLMLYWLCLLKVSGPLISRVENVGQLFNKEMEMEPRVSHEFELSLDSDSVLHTVQTLNFFQMKGEKSLEHTFKHTLKAEERRGM